MTKEIEEEMAEVVGEGWAMSVQMEGDTWSTADLVRLRKNWTKKCRLLSSALWEDVIDL